MTLEPQQKREPMIEPLGDESADIAYMADTISASTAPHTDRERWLEVEVARLKAEVADLHGAESVEATSRFLAMAADTVDEVMSEAKRKVNETRAEASELTATALAEAVEMREQAKAEALTLVAAERCRVADEVEALQSVREALESERHDLENYHGELRRRVKELAESMVSFMTTEEAMDPLAELDSASASAHDPVAEFAGVPVLQSSAQHSPLPDEPGLFDPASESELRDEESPEEHIEEVVEAQRFRAFIGGDDAHDKSRDWLLRPEQD